MRIWQWIAKSRGSRNRKLGMVPTEFIILNTSWTNNRTDKGIIPPHGCGTLVLLDISSWWMLMQGTESSKVWGSVVHIVVVSGGYVKEGLLPCARLSPVRSGVRQRPSVRQSGARARVSPLSPSTSVHKSLSRERERERERETSWSDWSLGWFESGFPKRGWELYYTLQLST